jgi:hypothetical protein
LLRGALVARYYYIYAVDYDRGGEWSGKAYMCSREKEFTIRGTDNCLARGYDRTGFFEVDTGEQRSWTVQLTDAAEQSPEASSRAAGAGRGVETADDVAYVATVAWVATAVAWVAASAWAATATIAAIVDDVPAIRTIASLAAVGDIARRRPTMRRLRRAKIVATLGPASSSAEMIARLFEAGADVFRINMSHTSQERMRELVGMIRTVERDTSRPIGVLIDLQGPKLRLGTFAGGAVMVKTGDSFVLDSDPAPGDATRAVPPHPEIFRNHQARPHAADRRRQGPPHGLGSGAQSASSRASSSAGKLSDRKGRQPSRYDYPVLGAC